MRARETAELVAAALDVKVVVDRRLGGGLDLSTLSDVLSAHADAERPCVVGHDPDFSEFLGELLGIAPVPMRKGAIARVDVGGGRWSRVAACSATCCRPTSSRASSAVVLASEPVRAASRGSSASASRG